MDGDGALTPERKMANVTLDILRTAEEAERTVRGNRSLDSLLAVVHGLRDLPGRKTLVYFSEGLQVPPWLDDPFRALASEANRAGVSIYSVDVRGLRVAGHLDDAHALLDQAVMTSGSQRLSGGAWQGVTREQARQFETVEATLRMDAQGTLDDLSKATGGFLIGDSNDLALGLRKLGEDTRHYYELAYAPSDPRYDGRFHRVSVKVKRPGASVQTRGGYFAIPHAVGEPVYGYEGPLLTALAARRRPRAFDHQSAVFRFEADAGRVQHALVVAAPLAGVTFRRDEGAGLYLGRVSVLALVKSESGDIVEKRGQDYVIEGRLADLDATRQRRIRFVRRVALPPGTYSVETAVRDALADRTGCSATRLVVAPAAPGVRMSSVVGLAGAMPATGEDRDDPFRVGEVRMTPDLGGRLRAEAGGDGPAVYYVVYAQPGAAEAAADDARGRPGRPRRPARTDRAAGRRRGRPHPVRGEGAGGGARPRRVHAAAVGHAGHVDGHGGGLPAGRGGERSLSGRRRARPEPQGPLPTMRRRCERTSSGQSRVSSVRRWRFPANRAREASSNPGRSPAMPHMNRPAASARGVRSPCRARACGPRRRAAAARRRSRWAAARATPSGGAAGTPPARRPRASDDQGRAAARRARRERGPRPGSRGSRSRSGDPSGRRRSGTSDRPLRRDVASTA